MSASHDRRFVSLLVFAALVLGACAALRGPPGWYALDISIEEAPNLFQQVARIASRQDILVQVASADRLTLRTRRGDFLNYSVIAGDIRFNLRPPGDPTRAPALDQRRADELKKLGYALAREAYAIISRR